MSKVTHIKDKLPSPYKDKSEDELYELIEATQEQNNKYLLLTDKAKKNAINKVSGFSFDADTERLLETCIKVAKAHGSSELPINKKDAECANAMLWAIENMSDEMSFLIASGGRVTFINQTKDVLFAITQTGSSKISAWRIVLAQEIKEQCCDYNIKFTSSPNGYAVKLMLLICESLDIKITQGAASQLIKKFKTLPILP